MCTFPTFILNNNWFIYSLHKREEKEKAVIHIDILCLAHLFCLSNYFLVLCKVCVCGLLLINKSCEEEIQVFSMAEAKKRSGFLICIQDQFYLNILRWEDSIAPDFG